MVMLEQMCDYEIGWCHYLRNDFPQAEKHFRPFLATFEATSYRAYCSYQLGCALDITGRHEEAALYMGKVGGRDGGVVGQTGSRFHLTFPLLIRWIHTHE